MVRVGSSRRTGRHAGRSILGAYGEGIVQRYVERGEDVRLAFSAYLGLGLRRCVVRVTTRRLLLVRSRYPRLTDEGLLWTDALEDAALKDNYERWHTNGLYTGNSYVTARRGNGSHVMFNPRSGFWGGGGSAGHVLAMLYSYVPGSFCPLVVAVAVSTAGHGSR